MFWSLTMRELQAMLDRRRAIEERMDRRAAMVSALLANIYRDEKKQREPFHIEDFMPGGRRGVQVQGSGPLDRCPECDTPRWRGHLITCMRGREHFGAQVAAARDHYELMKGTRHA